LSITSTFINPIKIFYNKIYEEMTHRNSILTFKNQKESEIDQIIIKINTLIKNLTNNDIKIEKNDLIHVTKINYIEIEKIIIQFFKDHPDGVTKKEFLEDNKGELNEEIWQTVFDLLVILIKLKIGHK
jgi:hypothetical protein